MSAQIYIFNGIFNIITFSHLLLSLTKNLKKNQLQCQSIFIFIVIVQLSKVNEIKFKKKISQ